MYRLITNSLEVVEAQRDLDNALSAVFKEIDYDLNDECAGFFILYENSEYGIRFHIDNFLYFIEQSHSVTLEIFGIDAYEIGANFIIENKIEFSLKQENRVNFTFLVSIGFSQIESEQNDVTHNGNAFFARDSITSEVCIFSDSKYYTENIISLSETVDNNEKIIDYIKSNTIHTVSLGGIIRSGLKVCRISENKILNDLIGFIDKFKIRL